MANANVRARHSAGKPRLVCSDTYHDSNTLYNNAVERPESTCDKNNKTYSLINRSVSADNIVQQKTIHTRLRPLAKKKIKIYDKYTWMMDDLTRCYCYYHESAKLPTAVPAKAPLTKPVKNNMAICVKSSPYELYNLYK